MRRCICRVFILIEKLHPQMDDGFTERFFGSTYSTQRDEFHTELEPVSADLDHVHTASFPGRHLRSITAHMYANTHGNPHFVGDTD